MPRAQFISPVDVIAQTRRLVRVRTLYNTVVNAGGGVWTLQLTAAAGYIARLIALGLYIPPPTGAASGSHVALITIGADYSYTAELVYTSGTVAYGTDITKLLPTTESLYKGLIFTETIPLQIRYTNSTDVATGAGNNRLVIALYEEGAIA